MGVFIREDLPPPGCGRLPVLRGERFPARKQERRAAVGGPTRPGVRVGSGEGPVQRAAGGGVETALPVAGASSAPGRAAPG